MIVIGSEDVRTHLPYARCIPLMRDAMIALSRGETRQLLRSIMDLDHGRAFGLMPGAMPTEGVFGAKLISVFPENFDKGVQSHQGLVVIFGGDSGAVTAVVHAGEITRIRTAAASAAATDALALPNAETLAILGYGEQAHAHAIAMSHVRKIASISVWGRDALKAASLARRLNSELGVSCVATGTAREAVLDADIICTTTAAPTPILESAWIKPGAHINAVGSSRAGPSEIAIDLVARARFVADYRLGVLAQGAEFLLAKQAGAVTDEHVLGEIGEVFDGRLRPRASDADVTLYKSLGHIVQDLASAAALLKAAELEGFGQDVSL